MNVKLVIGGQSFGDQVFNELTAPGLMPGMPDPLGAAGLRHGIMPINFGLPMLMGGRPEECTPKIPSGKPFEVEVTCPSAAQGGIDLSQAATIRLWVVKVLGVDKLKEVLKWQSQYTGQNYYDGNVMRCNFDLGDLEVSGRMPVRSSMTSNPISNMIPETGSFDPLEHWGKLPGGFEQDRPKMHVYSMFAKQMLATTTNEPYQFVMSGARVQDKDAEMYWDFTKRDALKITHLGFKNPALGTVSRMYLNRSGREIPQTYEVQFAKNMFPMPATRSPTALSFYGPGKLPKPFLVWNEIGSIEIRDNGTSVLPWALLAPDQSGVYARGIRYELNDREV